MKIGYARVSTAEQSLDRQADELRAAGCDRLFQEVASGRNGANRRSGKPASIICGRVTR